DASSEYYDPSKLPLIIMLDTPGRHLIAIRYANYRRTDRRVNELFETIGFKAYAGLGTEMSNEAARTILFDSVTLLILGGFFLALCFAHFVLWLYHRRDRANLYFSIFSLAAATFLFSSYVENVPMDARLFTVSTYFNYAA